MPVIRAIPSRWKDSTLVCKKCGKRAGGGFGPKGKTSLAKALRKHLGAKKGRKAAVGVVETGCLGLCPKGAITVLNGGKPGEWLAVPLGTSAADVAERLGLKA